MSEELQQSIEMPAETVSADIPPADAEPSPAAPPVDVPPARPEDVAGCQAGDEGQLAHGGSFRRPPTLPVGHGRGPGRCGGIGHTLVGRPAGPGEEGSHSGLVRRS